MKNTRSITAVLIAILMMLSCGQAKSEMISDTDTQKDSQNSYDKMVKEEILRRKSFDFLDITAPEQGRTYEYVEVLFDISTDFSQGDQFNSNICDIRVTLITPSGIREEAYAFYRQNESPHWAFRYNPREAGLYRFNLRDEHSGQGTEEYTIEVLPNDTDQRGFITTEKNKFKDSFNRQFTILGTNFAWGTQQEFAEALTLYGEHNINYIRFWSQCDWSVFSLESAEGTYYEGGEELTFGGLGDYNLDSAARMDWLLDQCEENNIYMQLCLFNFWDFYKGHWERNAYNLDNGGTCSWTNNSTDFWTDPVAVKYQKQLIRYIYSRYGASRAFAVLELWNECDNKVDQKKRVIRDDWHREMSDYWKSMDIYNHSLTTSYAWKDHPSFNDEFNAADPWKSQEFLDFANPHAYIAPGIDPVEKWIEQIRYTQQQHPEDKPVFMGEFSETDGELAELSDAKERYFTLGIWAPLFFADAAGSNLHWRVETKFLPSSSMLDSMEIASDIIGPFEENLLEMEHVSPGVKEGLRIGYFKKSEQAIGFVRHSETPYDKEDPSAQKDKVIEIPDMYKGEYILAFYNIYIGESVMKKAEVKEDGLLTISLPEFYRNIAFTAIRK